MLCVPVCCVCACTCLLLAVDTACTLMMRIIRNFLQLGRWWWWGVSVGWVGCEWVRKRGEVSLNESVGGGVCLLYCLSLTDVCA